MSGVTVSIDASAFSRALDRLGHGLTRAAQRALREALEGAERVAKTTTTYSDKTGTLRRKTVAQFRSGASDLEPMGTLLAATPYALFVEGGTKPHEIRPRKAPALRFFWPVLGRWVSAKRVQHPGTKPRLFMTNARNFGERSLQDDLEDYAEIAVREYDSET